MRTLLKVLIGAGVVLTIFGIQMTVNNLRLPKELGVENGRLAPTPRSPNGVSSQTQDPSKYVEAWPFHENAVQTKATILALLAEFPEAEVLREDLHYLHAVFTSDGFRFKDDVEFYLDEDHRIVHYRSASRVGYSDMGVNHKRQTILRQRYDALIN